MGVFIKKIRQLDKEEASAFSYEELGQLEMAAANSGGYVPSSRLVKILGPTRALKLEFGRDVAKQMFDAT